MAQQAIEMILCRQLASYLSTPVLILDPKGRLLFYNEPAELIVGSRFDETGPMSLDEWTATFTPLDRAGVPLAPEARPVLIALTQSQPVHGEVYIRATDHRLLHLEITAFPLVGQTDQNLGAMAIFWEGRD